MKEIHSSHLLQSITSKLFASTNRNNSNPSKNNENGILFKFLKNGKSFLTSQRIQTEISRTLEISRNHQCPTFVLQPEENGSSTLVSIDKSNESQNQMIKVKKNENKLIYFPGEYEDTLFMKYFQKNVIRENNAVMSGCIDSLINCVCTEDSDVMRAFIWTHSSFTTTNTMLSMLQDRFEKCCCNDGILSQKIKARIINAIKYWIENTWQMSIDKSMPIVEQTNQFLDLMKRYGMKKQVLLITDVMERILTGNSLVLIQSVSDTVQPITPSLHNVFKLKREPKLMDFPPLEFAKQITLFTSELFRKIKLVEFFKSTSNTTKNECFNIIEMTNFYNAFQNCLTELILGQNDLQKRSLIVERLDLIAYYCLQLNNFFIVVCIVTLFETSALHRLKRTFKAVSNDIQEKFETVRKVANMEGNWKSLRVAEDNCTAAMVPFLGLILSDLLFTNDGNKTITSDSTINFAKCRKLSDIVVTINRIQQLSYGSKILKSEEYQTYIIDKIQHGEFVEKKPGSDSFQYNISKQLEVSDCVTQEVFTQEEIPDGHLSISVVLPNQIKIRRFLPLKERLTLGRILNDINGKEFNYQNKKIFFFFFENQPNYCYPPNKIIDEVFFEHTFKTISFATVLSEVKYVNCIFEYNGSLANCQIPIDNTVPLIQQYPIFHTYILNSFPFIPLKISHDFTVEGFLSIQYSLQEYNWKRDDMLYLINISSLSLYFSNLDIDEIRFNSFWNYKKFEIKMCDGTGHTLPEQCTLMVVDQFILLYKEKVFQCCFPLDFVKVLMFIQQPRVLLRIKYEYPFEMIEKGISNEGGMSTPFTNNELLFDADKEVIQQLIFHLHINHVKFNKYQLFGISPEFVIQNSSYHSPKVLIEIIKAMYFKNDFFEDHFFENMSLEDAMIQSEKIESGVFIRYDTLPSPTLVGIFYMYFYTLNIPLLPINDLELINNFTQLGIKEQQDLLFKLYSNISSSLRGLVKVILELFSQWLLPNPSKIDHILSYSQFLFLELVDESVAKEIFKLLILKFPTLPPIEIPSVTFIEMIRNYSLTPIMDEEVRIKHIEDIKQAVNEPNAVNKLLNHKNSHLDLVKNPTKCPFKKINTMTLKHSKGSRLKIGKNRNGSIISDELLCAAVVEGDEEIDEKEEEIVKTHKSAIGRFKLTEVNSSNDPQLIDRNDSFERKTERSSSLSPRVRNKFIESEDKVILTNEVNKSFTPGSSNNSPSSERSGWEKGEETFHCCSPRKCDFMRKGSERREEIIRKMKEERENKEGSKESPHSSSPSTELSPCATPCEKPQSPIFINVNIVPSDRKSPGPQLDSICSNTTPILVSNTTSRPRPPLPKRNISKSPLSTSASVVSTQRLQPQQGTSRPLPKLPVVKSNISSSHEKPEESIGLNDSITNQFVPRSNASQRESLIRPSTVNKNNPFDLSHSKTFEDN
ncbi:Ras guanine nucleotide exchange factor, putative [Entamoeba nuttalli P19]|uniref:Ras guanine nucleotide exchange factor, putative n=1 Tax=Entamoeba nuttalli (strain P19) TaxID=1076696 RepID=K2HU40_ENTNP|nr:Ras guanine nucleotide exchange factor, putative [Entamoeba nuttalli P19]EKE39655.1 Ras guanine nucleotide exchange factor, putative [Entamoeba nuttalli P19]|eukprot:XP_008857997.1 Ras guanine nucleotide exchange factor, putative [Entamoeba nuttalli P19]